MIGLKFELLLRKGWNNASLFQPNFITLLLKIEKNSMV